MVRIRQGMVISMVAKSQVITTGEDSNNQAVGEVGNNPMIDVRMVNNNLEFSKTNFKGRSISLDIELER